MDKKVKVKGLKKKVKVVKVVKVVVKKVKVASETLLDWSSLEYLSDC
jgi:hypothetical protein